MAGREQMSPEWYDKWMKNYDAHQNQSVCSIAAEGVNLCRHGKLSWLQIATKRQVFLFDVFVLGAQVFKNGLQMILEDQNILKVIHDCRWLSDCLSHQYGIVLSNVFDTQVADVLQFSMETGGYLPHRISTLQECLMRYLRLPDKCVSFLEYKQQAMEEDPEVWFLRPLPPVLLNILALETVYLLPLRLLLLGEIMSDLTTLVDSYLNSFRQGSADPLGASRYLLWSYQKSYDNWQIFITSEEKLQCKSSSSMRKVSLSEEWGQ